MQNRSKVSYLLFFSNTNEYNEMQFCKSGETLIYSHLLFNFIVFVQCFHYNFTTVLVSGVAVVVFE